MFPSVLLHSNDLWSWYIHCLPSRLALILDKMDENPSTWSYFNAYCPILKSCTGTECTVAEHKPRMEGLEKKKKSSTSRQYLAAAVSALELQQLPQPKQQCLAQTKQGRFAWCASSHLVACLHFLTHPLHDVNSSTWALNLWIQEKGYVFIPITKHSHRNLPYIPPR